MRPPPDQVACPGCGVIVRVRLAAGEECPECRSARAWTEYSSDGRRLVLDEAAIRAAEARLRRSDADAPVWRRVLRLVPAVVAAGLAALAVLRLVEVLAHRPVGPLAALIDGLRSDAVRAVGSGAAALAGGIVALVCARRTALFRSWPVLSIAGLAVAAGAVTAAAGAARWPVAAGGPGLGRLDPGPVPESVTSPWAVGIMRATVAIVAPGEDGDALGGGFGSGAVVRSEPGRAWVVTCSHVAVPYLSPSSDRDSAALHPVWVQFADGRGAEGRVCWVAAPPLDVTIVSVGIDDPPSAVGIAEDGDLAARGDPVQFVPHPLRSGWLHHTGIVLRREPHATPAGTFSLIYTDLPLQRGDSGTGLFDANGRLVGINTWVSADAGRPVGIGLPSSALAGALAAAAAAGPAGQEESR